MNASGREFEDKIRELLNSRARDSTICPSEVARAMSDDRWRELMEPVRSAAARLVDAGEIEITQKGSVIDLATAKGRFGFGGPLVKVGCGVRGPASRK